MQQRLQLHLSTQSVNHLRQSSDRHVRRTAQELRDVRPGLAESFRQFGFLHFPLLHQAGNQFRGVSYQTLNSEEPPELGILHQSFMLRLHWAFLSCFCKSIKPVSFLVLAEDALRTLNFFLPRFRFLLYESMRDEDNASLDEVARHTYLKGLELVKSFTKIAELLVIGDPPLIPQQPE
jgi:hypothetical protein